MIDKIDSISIVIPCYNEEKNLKRGVLEEVFEYLKTKTFKYEVIICNDESTDSSLKIINQFVASHKNFRVVDLLHGGKPSAVWGGIQAAKFPVVLFTDMDQSTPLKELDKLLPWFDRGFDAVIGSRGSAREGNSLVRKIGSAVFLNIRRFLLLANINDTQCGFKAMKTKVAKEIFPQLQFFQDKTPKKGWRVSAYDIELLFIAQKRGYKIKEVTVDWKNEDVSTTKGDMMARYRKESINMIKEVWRVKSNDIKGVYDKK